MAFVPTPLGGRYLVGRASNWLRSMILSIYTAAFARHCTLRLGFGRSSSDSLVV